ncbi:Protein NipSnap [Fragariocoptes setiger]|uniref:Protein NipSnap n=1 Tax=Fragariocoptes setiger TaxID=1670756 RepID=A0ABQ7S758_9ACAR|nr:Protein NipSnap [Fragariocoptes setiger]
MALQIFRFVETRRAHTSALKPLVQISQLSIHISGNVNTDKSKDGQKSADVDPNQVDAKPNGWFNKLFVPHINTSKEPHSRLLSASEYIYEMHFHNAKPEASELYLSKYESYCKELQSRSKDKAQLVGSWRVDIGGDQDQFVHIWKYLDGYRQASQLRSLMRTDECLKKATIDYCKDLRKRESQFMMSFSFWEHPQPQDNNSFYEMRSYILKPGTMIDWANGWSRGITARTNAVAGFFSQIGQLYTVHHLWRYEDLQVRKDVRENAWRKPGWDSCVAHTVPLIKEMRSRWLAPTSFSPIR